VTADRLEGVRRVVDEILEGLADEVERQCGYVHLYGVSQACALLALQRGLDMQLCAVAGMLHDLSSYKSGDRTNHDRQSALEAERILGGLSTFDPDEIDLVCRAISHHRAKGEIDGDGDELLKDADVLQHYLYNPGFAPAAKERPRLERVLAELGVESG
jgi:uncharacterized protein